MGVSGVSTNCSEMGWGRVEWRIWGGERRIRGIRERKGAWRRENNCRVAVRNYSSRRRERHDALHVEGRQQMWRLSEMARGEAAARLVLMLWQRGVEPPHSKKATDWPGGGGGAPVLCRPTRAMNECNRCKGRPHSKKTTARWCREAEEARRYGARAGSRG